MKPTRKRKVPLKPKKTSTEGLSNDRPLQMELFPFNPFYRADESEIVAELLAQVSQTQVQSERITQQARKSVEEVRRTKLKGFSVENFLQTYHLNSQEGLALMCLAEALLRVPDINTKMELIRDRIGSVNWKKSSKASKDGETFLGWLTNFGLSTADIFMNLGSESKGFLNILGGLTRKLSDPVILKAVNQAMKVLGYQFVMGQNIEEALQRAKSDVKQGYSHSYDMLGEAAVTQNDATRYFEAYAQAIDAIGRSKRTGDIFVQPSISIKLSALHPRYEFAKRERVHQELIPIVLRLAKMAKDNGIGLTVDAEESERLDISIEVVEHLSGSKVLKGWNGFGLAVQAYQKRAPRVIDYLIDMARRHERRLSIRLVKGAYWDTEIKRTQERGLKEYPVFTRKIFTDLCYHVCAQKMLAASDVIYSQFATHNARTVATILELAGNKRDFEFQRLHGMGEALYEQILKQKEAKVNCRVYAPVGVHRDLLAYLVRRLLENGANTSFVHKIYDPGVTVETLIADPIEAAKALEVIPHPKIPLPKNMLQPIRQNSTGLDLRDQSEVQAFFDKMKSIRSDSPNKSPWEAYPVISGRKVCQGEPESVVNPSHNHVIGQVWKASPELVDDAMTAAQKAFQGWSQTPAEKRAHLLEKLGDSLENSCEELMTLLIHEGGKTVPDAVSEVREAVDFCRYYAQEARRLMSGPATLPGPTGELNQLSLHGRGVIVCISPWNFPLAIFTGQVVAALAAGNCVIAKPAHQTPLVSHLMIKLAHEAGIPGTVLHFLPGSGSTLGKALTQDRRTAGVAFTGSTAVAQGIALTLLSRENAPIVPLIAETGGMNAMIVDSTALPEQVVQDIIISAFQSAGQRCSALRMLFVQEDIADLLLEMLAGAMAEIEVGDPSLLSTDVGPVIDHAARKSLNEYEEHLRQTAKLIYRVRLDARHQDGPFIPPQAWELSKASQMTEEIFGPILHVVRFKGGDLDKVIDQINATGYGLTLGVHSRIDATINRVRERARVGNLYINRSMIGAVVGVQPFGGEGLSGTGPKAGGPNYLQRFTVERTFCQDTTASGGNATLLAGID